RYKRPCSATASINHRTGEFSSNGIHSHGPDPFFEEDMEMRRQIIHYARNTMSGDSSRKILNDFKLRCDPRLAARFTMSRMHAALYNARSEAYPRIPNTLLHLGILLGVPNLQAVCMTMDNRDRIFRGVIGDPDRGTVSVVFVSGRMLRFLQTRTNLHVDATFKKCSRKPKMRQMLNIVTNFGGTVIGIVRVLMESKSEDAYLTLFSYIKTLCPLLNPERVHCDFERGMMNSLAAVFPHSLIVGCLWHYGVAVSSTARELGLKRLVEEDENVAEAVRCLCAVPLLPSNLMWDGVLEIWQDVVEMGRDQHLGTLFHYFQRVWLPRRIELSCYNCPERTNNCSESDNHSIATVLPKNHPNIWSLVRGFVKLEHLATCDIVATFDPDVTIVNRKRSWRTINMDRSVRRITSLLENGDISPGQFLYRVSWSVTAALRHGFRMRRVVDESGSESDTDNND
ncbi:Non-structural protein 1, partial [Frankliniella fusca]